MTDTAYLQGLAAKHACVRAASGCVARGAHRLHASSCGWPSSLIDIVSQTQGVVAAAKMRALRVAYISPMCLVQIAVRGLSPSLVYPTLCFSYFKISLDYFTQFSGVFLHFLWSNQLVQPAPLCLPQG